MPDQKFDPNYGLQFGHDAANQAEVQVEKVCFYQKRFIELVNQGGVAKLKACLGILAREYDVVREVCWSIEKAVPPQAAESTRRYYLLVASTLVCAAFAFAHFGLSFFALGWRIWPSAAAVATVGVFTTDVFLEVFDGIKSRKMFSAGVFVVALGSLITLAFIRADISALHIRQAISETGVTTMTFADTVHFYEAQIPKLQLFFLLLTVAMELAAGLAIHEARKIKTVVPTTVADPRERLQAIETEMAGLVQQIVFLQNEPNIFEAEFKRNFYFGLSPGMVRPNVGNLFKRLICAILLVIAMAVMAMAQPPTVVAGFDLTGSSLAKDFDGNQSEYDKNADGIGRLIAKLPPGAALTVVGISDQSFSRPAILLAGRLPTSPGDLELLDQIEGARQRLAARMRNVAKSAHPQFQQTDILGFLMVAGNLLQESRAPRRILVIFSDMRHSAPSPNIETPARVPVDLALRTVEQRHVFADLQGVDVYIYGVHAGGKDVAYWQSLRDFWTKYFAKCNATLRVFSQLREVPDLRQAP